MGRDRGRMDDGGWKMGEDQSSICYPLSSLRRGFPNGTMACRLQVIRGIREIRGFPFLICDFLATGRVRPTGGPGIWLLALGISAP